MAEFYLDISAIGNEYQAYADTPTTWGVPQDGNGKAGPGHSAAVAIATISCSAASASGAGSLSLLGVTVSSTLTGSGATLAANIVTAINAATTAVTATYSQALLALNRLVWARQNPGDTTQVQVMMRIAGTNWNTMLPVSGGTWGTAPTMGAFAGGADGPFAYMVNNTTVFGKTAFTYGLFFAASAGVTEPDVTSDVIHCRTRRSGVDLVVDNSTTVGATYTWKSRRYLFDNGTVWSGDNGTLTYKFKNVNSSSTTVIYMLPASGILEFVSRESFNFHLEMGNTLSSGGTVVFCRLGSNARFTFRRCRVAPSSDHLVGKIYTLISDGNSGTAGMVADLSQSKLVVPGEHPSQFFFFGGAVSSGRIKMNGFAVEVTAATTTLGAFMSFVGATTQMALEWVGGEIKDTNGVYRCPCPFTMSSTSPGADINIDSVTGITDPAIGLTPNISTNAKLRWNQSEGANKGFRFERADIVVDWKGDGTFPYATAQNLQGDFWAHRITWNSAPLSGVGVVAFRASKFYRSAAATKTIRLDLYVPDSVTMYLDEMELSVSYIDSSGIPRNETVGGQRTAGIGSRVALSASGITWTSNGVASHSAKKIELTTAYPIKQGSEILALFRLCASRAPTMTFYASPELVLS